MVQFLHESNTVVRLLYLSSCSYCANKVLNFAQKRKKGKEGKGRDGSNLTRTNKRTNDISTCFQRLFLLPPLFFDTQKVAVCSLKWTFLKAKRSLLMNNRATKSTSNNNSSNNNNNSSSSNNKNNNNNNKQQQSYTICLTFLFPPLLGEERQYAESLEFNPVRRRDSGTFVCQAENSIGLSNEEHADIDVMCKKTFNDIFAIYNSYCVLYSR